ncbi:hypothetical protein D3C78_1372890 [compost metagenome]
MDQRLAVVDARDDEEAPVGRSSNGWKRGVGQAFGLAARRFGLQTELLGGQQQLNLSEAAAILGEFVSELLGGYGNVVETGQHD